MWIKSLFGPDTEVSTKRFVMVVLVVVLVAALFLLMYSRIEVPNKELVKGLLSDIFWLILFFGGFITVEQWLSKWKGGTPTNLINQDVQEQTIVSNDKKTVVRKK